MFGQLYNVFYDGEFVTSFDNAVELRRYMNEIEAESEDVFAEWQVLMEVKKGMFW